MGHINSYSASKSPFFFNKIGRMSLFEFFFQYAQHPRTQLVKGPVTLTSTTYISGKLGRHSYDRIWVTSSEQIAFFAKTKYAKMFFFFLRFLHYWQICFASDHPVITLARTKIHQQCLLYSTILSYHLRIILSLSHRWAAKCPVREFCVSSTYGRGIGRGRGIYMQVWAHRRSMQMSFADFEVRTGWSRL